MSTVKILDQGNHAVIHDLTCWNHNKFIYRYLLSEYDQSVVPLFRKFNYQLIEHTNLKNYFKELKRNFQTQYQQINLLYHINQAVIDDKMKNLMNKLTINKNDQLKISAYQKLTDPNRIDPALFDYIVTKCIDKIQPGDIIDIKNQLALGYYFVYTYPDNPNYLYIKKTQGNWGRFLPAEAWPYIESRGCPFYFTDQSDSLLVGCQLPTTILLNRKYLQEIVGGWKLVYFPISKNSSESNCYLINDGEYWGEIKEQIC